MKLYEIGQIYIDFMEETDFDSLTPEQVAEMLNAIEGEFDDKVDNIVSMIKKFEYESKAIKEEAKVLQARAKTKDKKAEGLTNYMYNVLKGMGKTEFETIRHHIKIKKNPPKLEISKDKEDEVIEFMDKLGVKEFIVESRTIDKKLLKDAIAKDGFQVPHASIMSGERLDIK